MTRLSAARVPIGARRRRFVLERPLDEPDGFGGHRRRFVAGPVVLGAMSAVAVQERVRGGLGGVVVTHRLDLRFRPDVAPPMRVVAGTRRFAIRAASDPDGRRRDLVCELEEIVEQIVEQNGETWS